KRGQEADETDWFGRNSAGSLLSGLESRLSIWKDLKELSKKRAERERRGILRDYGLAIGGSILVAFFIRFFVIEAYRMPSRAMQPAVEPGDTLFVSKRLFQ